MNIMIMKKITSVLFFYLLLGTVGFSQELVSSQVPNAVKLAFAKQFPTANEIKYESEKTDFKIGFQLQGLGCAAVYNAAGKLLETEKEITPGGLPKEVSSSVTKNFPGYTIMTVVRREAFDMGICFEMDLKKDDAGYSVRFSDKGEILQKVARKVEFRVITKSKK
jgi:hypothetical protein